MSPKQKINGCQQLSNMFALPAFCIAMKPQGSRRVVLAVVALFWFLFFLTRNLSHRELLQWMTLKSDDQRDPLLNGHQFSFSLDIGVCKSRNVDVIVFVHTAVNNFVRRMKCRDTWAGVKKIEELSLATVFMVGQTPNTSVQAFLEEESKVHHDIVQGNFIDAYTNLTYKHIMALGWIYTRCPDVKMIVKVDDDVIVNVFNMATFFMKYGFQKKLLYCLTNYYSFPQRLPGDKWYVGYTDYPFIKYPTFCSGAAYVMSPAIAGQLYRASSDIRFFWIDDLYVTGFLMLRVRATHVALVQGHDLVNSSKLTKDCMFVDAQHVWYSQWDYIVKSVPRYLTYTTHTHH